MTRPILATVGIAVAAAWSAAVMRGSDVPQSPAPQIQNGRVEIRPGAAVEREIAAVSPRGSDEPVWVAWRVPMVDGDLDLCSWYSDRLGAMRGAMLDADLMPIGDSRPHLTEPTGPIPLEAGTGLVVLVRVIGGAIERLRTVGDDCPMDAGGRTVYWLARVTPADSVRFLEGLSGRAAPNHAIADAERRLATTAVRALGYHRDAAADAALDRVASDHADASVRRQATSTLTSMRGAHGVGTVTRLIAAATDAAEKRLLVNALGQSRQPAALTTLRSLSRDPDAAVRGEAVYWFVLRGGTPVIAESVASLRSEPEDAVKKRIVSAIGRLPGDAGVPALLDLVGSSTDALVRREAVSALSQSKDPRAMALMEEILKR